MTQDDSRATPAESRPVRPARWVPTLYFAEGIPFFAVSLMAGVLYKRMGLPNDVIALATSWLLLPWSLKPVWSPLLEMFKTKKFFVVLFELAGGLSLALVALSLPLPGFFRYSIAFFAVVAFCSATHDIAADGLYIASLSPKQQASFAGWQGGFFNVARFFSQGALVIFAGFLESRVGTPRAWMVIFVAVGLIMILIGLYHARVLPKGGAERVSRNFQVLIGTAMSGEMFGYGFGFVGVILLMMQEIAPGPYQTAHYAFATALMNLGLMLPGTVSGKIQMAIGYRNFFLWVLICSLPALILARFVPIRGGAGQAASQTGAPSQDLRAAGVSADGKSGQI